MDETNNIRASFDPVRLFKRDRAKVVFVLVLFVIFIVSGYLMSDDLFFK
jgi:hypothetical protein